jgi:hypothetical protein
MSSRLSEVPVNFNCMIFLDEVLGVIWYKKIEIVKWMLLDSHI